jgi:hypothetical protein
MDGVGPSKKLSSLIRFVLLKQSYNVCYNICFLKLDA